MEINLVLMYKQVEIQAVKYTSFAQKKNRKCLRKSFELNWTSWNCGRSKICKIWKTKWGFIMCTVCQCLCLRDRETLKCAFLSQFAQVPLKYQIFWIRGRKLQVSNTKNNIHSVIKSEYYNLFIILLLSWCESQLSSTKWIWGILHGF